MVRYNVIREKNPREIILLRGKGCKWRKCIFCDYYLDSSEDEEENFIINNEVINMVSGIYKKLEVINSGSFLELGDKTLNRLIKLCEERDINTLHFECHWIYKDKIADWRRAFEKVGTVLKIKIGVESFDYNFREGFLKKGILERDPRKISDGFDECCLLFGLTGQTAQTMKLDIETGLKYFERVCVNIFVKNKTKLNPDNSVISEFIREVMPSYKDNDRVDILTDNLDFGVGRKESGDEK